MVTPVEVAKLADGDEPAGLSAVGVEAAGTVGLPEGVSAEVPGLWAGAVPEGDVVGEAAGEAPPEGPVTVTESLCPLVQWVPTVQM